MFTTCSDCNNDFFTSQERTVCSRCEAQSAEYAEIESSEQEAATKARLKLSCDGGNNNFGRVSKAIECSLLGAYNAK